MQALINQGTFTLLGDRIQCKCSPTTFQLTNASRHIGSNRHSDWVTINSQPLPLPNQGNIFQQAPRPPLLNPSQGNIFQQARAMWSSTNSTNSLFESIIKHGDLDLLEMALFKYPSIDRLVEGTPLLVWATRYNKKHIVEYLLANGATVNTTDSDNGTAIAWSAFHGHTPIFKLLLENGGDPMIPDKSGKNAWTYATERGHVEIMNLREDVIRPDNPIDCDICMEPKSNFIECKQCKKSYCVDCKSKWTKSCAFCRYSDLPEPPSQRDILERFRDRLLRLRS